MKYVRQNGYCRIENKHTLKRIARCLQTPYGNAPMGSILDPCSALRNRMVLSQSMSTLGRTAPEVRSLNLLAWIPLILLELQEHTKGIPAVPPRAERRMFEMLCALSLPPKQSDTKSAKAAILWYTLSFASPSWVDSRRVSRCWADSAMTSSCSSFSLQPETKQTRTTHIQRIHSLPVDPDV